MSREIHYLASDGVYGYAPGDILVERQTGERSLAVRTGAGVQLEPAPASAKADIVDMPFALATDVTSIRYRLHPLDVGFDLRRKEMPVVIDDDPLRVSYADRHGDRRVMSGPRAAIVARLEELGYRVRKT